MNALHESLLQLQFQIGGLTGSTIPTLLWRFFPFIIIFELPVQLAILVGVVRYAVGRRALRSEREAPFTPSVSCAVVAYGEGDSVALSIRSLLMQRYAGPIEVIVMVDGAALNGATLRGARALESLARSLPRRSLHVVPKWQRGGRVSSTNAALEFATGEIFIVADADTSFDNDMVAIATQNFRDLDTVAVSGNIRVRNSAASPIAGLQGLEYMLSIGFGRTGLSAYNAINNISGAFGLFRSDFLRAIGGWNTGTAEDLDLTLRIKQYVGRNPDLRIRFDPRAIGHTEAPTTFGGYLKQRLRWDGDLYHTYVRAHRLAFSPKLVGRTNFIALVWTGLFWQLLLPALIFVYTSAALFTGLGTLGIVVPIVYGYYFLTTLVTFGAYLACVSDRPREDARFLIFTPFYPMFALVSRLWAFVATLHDAISGSYLDSSMAPYWVLRMGRF